MQSCKVIRTRWRSLKDLISLETGKGKITKVSICVAKQLPTLTTKTRYLIFLVKVCRFLRQTFPSFTRDKTCPTISDFLLRLSKEAHICLFSQTNKTAYYVLLDLLLSNLFMIIPQHIFQTSCKSLLNLVISWSNSRCCIRYHYSCWKKQLKAKW